MRSAPEARVRNLLSDRGMTIATAESCTGGLLGDRITSVPGSSEYYLGGVIAYANEVKEHILGVPKATMVEHGAVSEQSALEMARGARRVMRADYGLSVTGIAGPGGGTDEKPVGLTWVAVSAPEGDVAARHIYQGDREENKHSAVDSVLELLLEVLQGAIGDTIQVEYKRDRQNRFVPLAITLSDRVYQVIDWGRRWQEGDREHMLVRSEGGKTFEIAFDEGGASWRLIRELRTPRGPADVA